MRELGQAPLYSLNVLTDCVDYDLGPALSSDTGSDSAIDFLLQKYHTCRESHILCNTRGLGN